MHNRPFSHFVIFAGMRTGSNFLETNINKFPDLRCYGELFNPYFIGEPDRESVLGFTQKQRDKDPLKLLEKLKQAKPGQISGFRLFHDHDPRVMEDCLSDKACGKVVLTRNPLETYVSQKIAHETNQWRLTHATHRIDTKVTFDARAFEAHLQAAQDFQIRLQAALQATGQTAFYLSYEDIKTLDVLNGLARFLGSEHQVEVLFENLKRQNAGKLEDKVANVDEMRASLAKLDLLNLARTPSFEPRRGAGVPRYIAGQKTPLLFIPIKGGPDHRIRNWMAALEGCQTKELARDFNQKSLREWRAHHPGFQSFCIIRHPLARAHRAFCDYILPTDRPNYQDIRKILVRDWKMPLPRAGEDDVQQDLAQHRDAFLIFMKFLKANLWGQTNTRIDAAWASQTAVVQGASKVVIPAHVIHETQLEQGLSYISALSGLPEMPVPPAQVREQQFDLAEIYDEKLESLARDAYAKDYQGFGFSNWFKTA